MDKLVTKISRILYILLYLFSATLMSSNKFTGGLWSTGGASSFIYLKLIFAFLLTFSATNAMISEVEYITQSVKICNMVLAALFVVDYCTNKISGTMILYNLWWIGAVLSSSLGVITAVTINVKKSYNLYFKRFIDGITPIYAVMLALIFIRRPGIGLTHNFKLFKGTISMFKSFIYNPTGNFEAPLIFFGNIFAFFPMPFILKTLFPKIKEKALILIGILCPIFAESYQFIFKCGNVDIDDFITNFIGFLLGYELYKFIDRKKSPIE